MRHLLQISIPANWVCLWSVYSLSDVWQEKRAKSTLVNLSPKSTLSQTCTHTHRNTLPTTKQRRGVWDIPQTASCSWWMALVSQRTIWPATCVGSECLPDWLVASGFCVLFWERLPYSLSSTLAPSLLFLLISSGLQRVSWEPGLLPCCQLASLPLHHHHPFY